MGLCREHNPTQCLNVLKGIYWVQTVYRNEEGMWFPQRNAIDRSHHHVLDEVSRGKKDIEMWAHGRYSAWKTIKRSEPLFKYRNAFYGKMQTNVLFTLYRILTTDQRNNASLESQWVYYAHLQGSGWVPYRNMNDQTPCLSHLKAHPNVKAVSLELLVLLANSLAGQSPL